MNLFRKVINCLVEGAIMLGVEIILDKGDRNFLSNKKTFGSKLCFFFSVFIEVILIASSILQFFNGNPLDGTIYMLFGIGIAIYFIVIKENQKGGKDNGQ